MGDVAIVATFYIAAGIAATVTIVLALRRRLRRPAAVCVVTAIGGLVATLTPVLGLDVTATTIITVIGGLVATLTPLLG